MDEPTFRCGDPCPCCGEPRICDECLFRANQEIETLVNEQPTQEWIVAKLKEQNGACDICGNTDDHLFLGYGHDDRPLGLICGDCKLGMIHGA